jgi:hypothetical protein
MAKLENWKARVNGDYIPINYLIRDLINVETSSDNEIFEAAGNVADSLGADDFGVF